MREYSGDSTECLEVGNKRQARTGTDGKRGDAPADDDVFATDLPDTDDSIGDQDEQDDKWFHESSD